MKTKVLLGLLILIPIVTGCSDRTPETASASQAAPSASVAGNADIWVTTKGDRGEMKWVQGPKVWPEVIVLRLTTKQLRAFEGGPKEFLNKPSALFSKPVINVFAECTRRTAVDEESETDVWYVIIDHVGVSNSCGAAIPVPSLNADQDKAKSAKGAKGEAKKPAPKK